MQISTNSAAVASQLPAMLPARGISKSAFAALEASKDLSTAESRDVHDLRQTFAQVVGETFFGQMMKSMRSMTDKPAYFHGGRAEEVFQSQLDQKLAEHLTEASAHQFAEPMFERQFPQFSARDQSGEGSRLTQLRRY
ncbi:MAG TPA: rod-binding protein [Lacipirellulaceae bacterium]|nr:rod-binding protein [Lacipirellulaceae bacterium]